MQLLSGPGHVQVARQDGEYSELVEGKTSVHIVILKHNITFNMFKLP
jgi:hypothetical protein